MADHDVLVIGGGPAGATAAYRLAKLGYRVLIIDKARFPRPKLCGGMVSLKTVNIIKAIYGDDLAELRAKKVIDYSTDGYEISYRLTSIMVKGTSHIEFHLADRVDYDAYFLGRARAAGADLVEGEAVVKVDLEENAVFLSTGKAYKARFIIGADGANSVVRQAFIRDGLCDKREWHDQMASCLEVYIDRAEVGDGKFPHPMLVFGFVKWGYAWVFPNKDRIVVGLGGLVKKNKGRKFSEILGEFLSALQIKTRAPVKIQGHPIPYGNFDLNPVANESVILVGDAGGYVDPLWGEGLYLAHRTGELAAEALDRRTKCGESLTTSYTSVIKAEVCRELAWAKWLRRFSFHPLNTKCNFVFLKILLRSLTKQILEMIHGVRSYRWLRRRKENAP
ncbi:MAG: NAD(P)/FAD-dependent oxidoreductase [Candidatus Lokiarchaeota archaeon]|nr:NAD(P)/FAD-dependent oxidoreductase [Candidatus Lokiarchaeota archaeon]